MADPKNDFTNVIPAKINADIDAAKDVDAVFLFKITGDNGGTWTVNLKDAPGVTEGDAGNSDCAIEISDEHWGQIMEDPNQAMQLYFQGALKVEGNAMLATKLQTILG